MDKYKSLCQKLKSEENQSCVNVSDFDESEMSEISVKNEVDCASFVKDIVEPKRDLIYDESIEFETLVKNQGLNTLREKFVVCPKVKLTVNQVFVKMGLDKNDTSKLKSIVETDNSCSKGKMKKSDKKWM